MELYVLVLSYALLLIDSYDLESTTVLGTTHSCEIVCFMGQREVSILTAGVFSLPPRPKAEKPFC